MQQVTFDPGDETATLALAALLKRFRTRSRLSQQALADKALISVQAVSALERGYRKAPYRDTLHRLADALALHDSERDALENAAQRARTSRLGEHVAPPPHNLPRQLTSFLGRESVVAEVIDLVTASPLVSLVATGGAGKTRVAIEVGTRVLHHFRDGVTFVDLGSLNDPALLTKAVAAALRVQESSQRQLVETLIAYLARKQQLIIFDNCEHLIAQARTVVGSLMRECPAVSALVTSRESLGIAGERVYRMPPLALPRSNGVAPTEAMRYGAIALFADRAKASDARFAVAPENVRDVIDICRRLDGLPLAIELAAARAMVLSPSEINGRLERLFDTLNLNGSTAIARHQTMRATIEWSYTLLSSPAKLLFDRLSIFAGGFTLDSATAVCADDKLAQDDILELLTSLVMRSLVMVDFVRGATRYKLLESTRLYGAERLRERGEAETTAGRHALASFAAGEGLDADWYTVPERLWFSQARSELDNYRAALEWSLSQRNDVSVGRRLAAALARLWYSLSPVEGRRWVRLALEARDAAIPTDIAAALHIAEAELCGALGEYKASLSAAQLALDMLSGSSGDSVRLVRARQAAGSALSALGCGPEADGLLDEALVAARRLNNRRLQALILGDLGTTRSRHGDISAARLLYAEALAEYVALGLERPAASIAGHLAEVEFAAGNSSVALERAQEARRGHEATNNRRSTANDLSNIAAYLLATDRYEEAREYAFRAVLAARDVGGTVLTAYALQHVAAVEALRPQQDLGGSGATRSQSAILMGFVDARLTSLEAGREHTEQQEYDRMLAALRSALGADKLADLMRLGAAWTEDGAVTVALGV